ncbi:MAG: carbohydrate kinase family protein [Phycisphaeraceae bacterium]|nr:carbohydrate kinase family protein [Phycisphaeraceae bacterium]
MSDFNQQQSIIVAGHICLDLTPRFPESALSTLIPGSLVRVDQMHCSVGGAVANTGLALHQLGVKTRLMGRISDDLFGKEVKRILSGYDPALTCDMIQVAGESTSYSVVVAPPGVDRLFLHCPGCNDLFEADDIILPKDQQVKLLHFGYPPVMRSVYRDDGQQLVSLFHKAHAAGIATSLDMCSVDPTSEAGGIDWQRWLANVLPHVDIFVPSLDELLFMLGISDQPVSLELLQSVGKQILDSGVGVLMLKLGEQGVYLQTAQQIHAVFDAQSWSEVSLHCPCYSVDVVSTNGAGDYTIAGFLAAILAGQTPSQALHSAVGVGAWHVQSPDELARWDVIQKRIDGGWEQLDKTLS